MEPELVSLVIGDEIYAGQAVDFVIARGSGIDNAVMVRHLEAFNRAAIPALTATASSSSW